MCGRAAYGGPIRTDELSPKDRQAVMNLVSFKKRYKKAIKDGTWKTSEQSKNLK